MIARILIDGEPITRGKEMERAAESILLRTFAAWPSDHSARFLITPGGFLESDLPSGLSGHSGWKSGEGDFRLIQRAAETVVRKVVTPRVLRQAAGKTASLTVGIDLDKSAGLEAELVAFIRMADGRVLRWTGKSYPTASQAKSLIQVVDLESHCLRFEGDGVLVLGCHDLNMFSPRGWSTQRRGGDRRKRCSAMRLMVHRFRSTVVLHHPHTTDSASIWRLPWTFIGHEYPTVNDWASGVCFYKEGGERGTLRRVATATRSASGGLDFVFRTIGGRIEGPKLLPTSLGQ